ncbi:putative F-box protein [Raphanus sativus]|nr:putative F-box protein [Raphanus sativus]
MMKLTNVNMKSDSLPVDLVMEILKRLPVKTLIRFLSVSKLWASTIRSRDFMKLFLNVSLTRPKGLLFLFRHGYCGLALYPKTHEPSSFTTFHVSFHSSQWSTVSPSVHGLICYAQATTLVIYNPCTRRSIALPEIDTWRRPIRYYLGHDPMENDYKVLCAMLGGTRDLVKEFRVLTLGTESSWKMIENNLISHAPFGRELCINGVLYYQGTDARTT